MKIFVTVALVGLTCFGGGVAHAEGPGPVPAQHVVRPDSTTGAPAGLTCGLASITDPTIENADVRTGALWGGPLAYSDLLGTISMTCTVQVGGANGTHAGVDSASAASATSSGTTVVPPTFYSFLAPEGQPIYLCTTATLNSPLVGTVTRYWDAVSKVWSASSGVPCAQATPVDATPDWLDRILEILWVEVVDPLLCPVTAAFVGTYGVVDIDPDGDVSVIGSPVWSCPPYEG